MIARWAILGFVLLWSGVASAQCPQEEIHSDVTHRYPYGIALGDESGVGFLDWDPITECFYIDSNCDSMKQPEERSLCDCECDLPSTTTTSSSTSTSSSSTTTSSSSSTTTTTTSTSLTTTTALGSTTSTTTSTSTSTTTTTILDATFADSHCYTLIGTRAEHDEMVPWISPSDEETIYAASCHCEGECITPVATFVLRDSGGNDISFSGSLACDTGDAASTWTDTDAGDLDRVLAEGERYHWGVTNTPGSYDRVTLCVRFTE